jgi:predicted O-methyltransferase YrrM
MRGTTRCSWSGFCGNTCATASLRASVAADPTVTDFDAAYRVSRDVEGWMTPAQAQLLWERASKTRPGTSIIEIGSHHGKSTVLLAAASRPAGCRVVAVDPFDDPRWGGGPESAVAFAGTLRAAGVHDDVDVVRGISASASATWDGPSADLVYVDGAHDLASVLQDIDGWDPHLNEGGWMLFHDAFSSHGVTRAIFRRFFFNRNFNYRGSAGSLATFSKGRVGLGEVFIARLRMIGRLAYFARNLLVKLAIRRKWSRLRRALGQREPVHPY